MYVKCKKKGYIMKNILSTLNNNILVGDGAMGTMLQKYGLVAGEIPEEWVIKYPERILNIHEEYINAGSMLIETNTFGGNRIKLKMSGLEEKIEKINSEAVAIARRAARGKYVVGSVGPTGKMMEPYGKLSFTEAVKVYEEQINILASAGVDAILIETMSDLQEIRAAVVAARDIKVPVIAQMTFSENNYTLTGNTPEVAAIVLDNLGADIIGVNCTSGIINTLPIIKRIHRVTSKPISVFPNAGKPVLKDGKVTYPQTPAKFVSNIDELLKSNVKIIGGCCGTTPEHIEMLVKKLDNNCAKITYKKQNDNDKILLAGSREHIILSESDYINEIKEKYNEQNLKKFMQVLKESDCDIIYMDIDKIKYENLAFGMQKPVIIKSNKEEDVEKFLQKYAGRALVFISQDRKDIISIASKYGAYIGNKDKRKKFYNSILKIKKPVAGLIKE